MKIGSNIEQASEIRLRKSTTISPKEYEVDRATAGSIQTTSRSGVNSQLSNALAIAKISQQLLNEALTVSSQLQNMANQIANGDRVTQEEISPLLAKITNSNNGEVYSIPVESIVVPDLTHQNIDFKENLETLKQHIDLVSQGEIPKNLELVKNSEDLQSKAKILDESITKIEDTMSRQNSIGKIKELSKPEEDVSTLAQQIVGTSSVALAAQGNIPSEYVAHILG